MFLKKTQHISSLLCIYRINSYLKIIIYNIQKKRQNVCISQTFLDLTHADVFYVTSRNITSSIMGAIRDYTTKFQEIRLITFYLKMFYKQKCRAWKKEIWVSYWMLIDR